MEGQGTLRKFKVTTEFHELKPGSNETWERLAQIGHTVEGPTFAETLPKISEAMNEQWMKVSELAPIVDEPYENDDE